MGATHMTEAARASAAEVMPRNWAQAGASQSEGIWGLQERLPMSPMSMRKQQKGAWDVLNASEYCPSHRQDRPSCEMDSSRHAACRLCNAELIPLHKSNGQQFLVVDAQDIGTARGGGRKDRSVMA